MRGVEKCQIPPILIVDAFDHVSKHGNIGNACIEGTKEHGEVLPIQ